MKKKNLYPVKYPVKVGILMGYGDNCDCLKYGADCPVLYGAECNWRFKPESL